MPTVATALTSGLQSLARAVGPASHADHASEAVLYPLDSSDRIVPSEAFRFQYFPESVRVTKQTNRQQKEIPGGSLPVYQFISGGEHLVAFTAQFSCDTDLLSNANVAAELEADGLRERNPDIRAASAWLRQFVTPRYGSGPSPMTPPRKLVLSMPGTGIGVLAGVAPRTERLMADSIFCEMTQCDITLQALFPSGLPRLQQIELSFAQIAQYGGAVNFPGVGSLHDTLLTTGGAFRPYRLRPRAHTQRHG